MSEHPILSIIIVNWNAGRHLQNCLASVYGSEGVEKMEVFVVDNASTDDSIRLVQDIFPQVCYILNDENLGFARANLQGYEVARGEYILMLNPDTVLQPETLQRSLAFVRTNEGIGCLGCKLLDEDGTHQPSEHNFPTISRIFFARLFPTNGPLNILPAAFQLERSSLDQEKARPVDYVKGAFMLFPRKALEQVGFLDPEYFMYAEEADLCYRLWDKGWKVMYYPGAEAIHIRALSARQIPAHITRARRCISRHRFMRKHYGVLYAAIYHVGSLFMIFLAFVVRTPILLIDSGRRQHELAYMRFVFALEYPR